MSESNRTKRIRRRKYPRPGDEGSSYILLHDLRTGNVVAGGNDALVPPGFEPIVGNARSETDQENGSNDLRVGHTVSPRNEPIIGNIKGEMDQENGSNDLVVGQTVSTLIEPIVEKGKGEMDQENGSNDLRVGKVVSALIEEEFDGGFWVSVRDDNANVVFRGQILKTKPPHADQSNVVQRSVVPLPDIRSNEKHVTVSEKNIATNDSLFPTSQGRGTSLSEKMTTEEGNQSPLLTQTQASQSVAPLVPRSNIVRLLSSAKVMQETAREIMKRPFMSYDFENLVTTIAERVNASSSNDTDQVTDINDHLSEQK